MMVAQCDEADEGVLSLIMYNLRCCMKVREDMGEYAFLSREAEGMSERIQSVFGSVPELVQSSLIYFAGVEPQSLVAIPYSHGSGLANQVATRDVLQHQHIALKIDR
jgi:hypothetical protein